MASVTSLVHFACLFYNSMCHFSCILREPLLSKRFFLLSGSYAPGKIGPDSVCSPP